MCMRNVCGVCVRVCVWPGGWVCFCVFVRVFSVVQTYTLS